MYCLTSRFTSLVSLIVVTLVAESVARSITSSVDPSFFLSKAVRHEYERYMDIDRSEDVYLPYEMDAALKNETSKNARSCPWIYRMVYNENRVPSTHLEVKCLSTSCLDVGKFTNDMDIFDITQYNTYKMNNSGCCLEVLAPRWVKVKRMTPRGTVRYVNRILQVPVGCSCSRCGDLQAA